MVKSTLLEFSTNKSDSELSDAENFSPALNEPETFVKIRSVPDVPSAKTQPVAPEVSPLTWTPPLPWLASNVGEGVPDKVIIVNGLKSHRYNL